MVSSNVCLHFTGSIGGITSLLIVQGKPFKPGSHFTASEVAVELLCISLLGSASPYFINILYIVGI